MWLISELISLDFTYNATLFIIFQSINHSLMGNSELEYGNTRTKSITFTLKFSISEAITYCIKKYLHWSKCIEIHEMTAGVG